MRRWGAAGSLAIGLALGLALGNAGPASADDYFAFRLCNSSGVDAVVAVAYRPDPNRWVVGGWISVAAGDCREFSGLLKNVFYFYGEQDTRSRRKLVWAGNDTHLCVEYPGPFQRVHNPGHTCEAHLLRGFTQKYIPDDVGRFTLTLQ